MRLEILGCASHARSLLPRPRYRTIKPKVIPPPICKEPMGLENGLLLDSQITASKSYSSHFKPEFARLGSDSVWAAADLNEPNFLQVDFLDNQNISGLVTKGREDVPQWVTAYVVAYSNDGISWNEIKDEDGNIKDFPANYDQFSTVTNLFPSTIRARFIRILPTKWKNWISLQIEVLGCYHPMPCRDPLGIDNGIITNYQLSASSQIWDSVSPSDGRLSSKSAWSPSRSDKNPYFQVDLLEPVKVTGVLTKGSPDVQQWVKSFYVSYSNDTISWKKIENAKGRAKKFLANIDQESAVANMFPIPKIARYVRLLPLQWHKWISLRLELLGCFEEQSCREPMGLENGVLSDGQITASSSSDIDTTPNHVRIGDKSGWQPDRLDKQPYLQVDFLEPRNVSALVTKGMEDVDNWVTRYKVEHSDDGDNWQPIVDDSENELEFRGNEDRNSPVINTLPEAIEARFFRIIPLSSENDIGLRLELLGCYHPYVCQEALGMESGAIYDFQISASSYLNPATSAINARLDSDTAWVAGGTDDAQYIQVDLLLPTNVTGVMTRGRNDANEWVKVYHVAYSMDGDTWNLYTENDNPNQIKEFRGNEDNESPVTNLLPEPLLARFLRIIPTEYERKMSLRFEIIGCSYERVCLEPMGIENNLIADSQITASSYTSDSTNPSKLRLGSDSAWSPKAEDEFPSIQVNFGDPRNISAIVTKGSVKQPAWVTGYRVVYSSDEDNWFTVDDDKGKPIDFPGNTDENTPVTNVFPDTIEAQFVRIIPMNWKNRISLRAEILGCYHPYEFPETTEEVLPLIGIPDQPQMITVCPDPMKAEGSLLEDATIRASSSNPDGNPSRVLLNTRAEDGLSGGWVPEVDDMHPVLVVEFPDTIWLTSIFIQGRDEEENWVKTLRVIASPDNVNWFPVFGPDGDETLQGNEDQHSVVGHYFMDPVEALSVKIIPESWHKWPSFRLDLRGCHLPKGSSTPMFETTVMGHPSLCPELANEPELSINCPIECPPGQLCDGETCVDPVDCSCVHDGQIFKVSDKIEDQACKQCDCALGGHSICSDKVCPPCEENQKSLLDETCSCSCEECEEGEVICPTSDECIPRERWCDGIIDCPDDEISCLTTTPEIPTTEPELIIPTTLPPPKNATCEVLGKHIKTFDGQDIVYDICNHIAMSDIKNDNFNVSLGKACTYTSGCEHWLEMKHKFHEDIKVYSNLSVEIGGSVYTASQLSRLSKKSRQKFRVRKVGEQVVIKSLIEGFTITYDIRAQVKIEVPPELDGQIAGLCGFFNGIANDDQRKPNGKKAFTSREFGDSWSTNGGVKECAPILCPHEEMMKALEECNKLREEPFTECSKILPVDHYIEFCMSSMCECLLQKKHSDSTCKCDSFQCFVEACEEKLGPMSVRNWRLKHECHSDCPPGMEWKDCGPSCQLTCDSTSVKSLDECSGKCVAGCFCPPGTVLNEDTCIPPEQCADQMCQGFGDPHFRTFDGLFFPFLAEGSFLIVSDKDNKLTIRGISKKCGLFTPMTCLIGLDISYRGHKVMIKKRKELKVDGKKIPMEKLPLHSNGVVILGYPGRTFIVVIPQIHLEARYYEENSGFAVRVPSRKYFNKTEGLCGNCNGQKDDELKGEPLSEFVCSWQTEGDKNECKESFEDLPVIKERLPICDKLEDSVFKACHPLVDLDVYVDACNFDAIHSGDAQASFCKTAMEYGRQCCQAGIAVEEWPEKLGCDIKCPENTKYEQCHRGCPQTCVSVKNDSADPSCIQLKTDGCFCPEGKVLKNGDCVDTLQCETCDEEGHVPGDSWKDGECKKCHCRSDLTTACVVEVCPPITMCSVGEMLVNIEDKEAESCCEKYSCVPKEKECVQSNIPQCPKGEVAKFHTGADLCPELKCECDPLLCPPLMWPEDLEDGQEAKLINDSCCPAVAVFCHHENCPEKPDCQDGLELIEAEGECCTVYKCKPPKDACVYTHVYKVIDGLQSLIEPVKKETSYYKLDEEWDDGLCEKCSCVESMGQLVPQCIMEQCLSIDDMPENKEYVLLEYQIPGKCCPEIFRTHCRDEDANVYEPGEQWQDENDPCVTYLCEQLDVSDVRKTKNVMNCTECPRTAVLFPPSKILGQCCGVCKVTKCEDGDELYSVGDTWISPDDPCRQAECVSEYGKVKTIYTKQQCPTIPKDCPKDKIVWDENHCCEVCNLTSEISCSKAPIPEEDTIGFFTYHEPQHGGICVNEKTVPGILQCSGACHSRSYYSLEDGDFKDMCQCCKVNVTTNRMIELRCPDGNYIKKLFLQPESCQCSKCAPKNENNSVKNNFNNQFNPQQWVQSVVPDAFPDNSRDFPSVWGNSYEQKPWEPYQGQQVLQSPWERFQGQEVQQEFEEY